jgi:hypothetical protein
MAAVAGKSRGHDGTPWTQGNPPLFTASGARQLWNASAARRLWNAPAARNA